MSWSERRASAWPGAPQQRRSDQHFGDAPSHLPSLSPTISRLARLARQANMSDRTFFVGGNWKMNGSLESGRKLVGVLNDAKLDPKTGKRVGWPGILSCRAHTLTSSATVDLFQRSSSHPLLSTSSLSRTSSLLALTPSRSPLRTLTTRPLAPSPARSPSPSSPTLRSLGSSSVTASVALCSVRPTMWSPRRLLPLSRRTSASLSASARAWNSARRTRPSTSSSASLTPSRSRSTTGREYALLQDVKGMALAVRLAGPKIK